MSTLGYLVGESHALDDLIDEARESDLDTVATWIAGLDGDIDAKGARCIAYIREQEALADARTAEAERLRDAAKVAANRAKRTKDALGWLMRETDRRKIETTLGTITIANNGGKVPVEVLVPPEQLAVEWTRIEVRADVDKIRAALEAGDEIVAVVDDVVVPGARLGVRGTHVRIK